jgi:hypothetical protein
MMALAGVVDLGEALGVVILARIVVKWCGDDGVWSWVWQWGKVAYGALGWLLYRARSIQLMRRMVSIP